MKPCQFERAIFLSWYCSLGDCKFCYMSTQKEKIKDPRKARRKLSSVLAEVLICKQLGWGLEFVSAGYGALKFNDLLAYLQAIKKVWGKKIWLNIGYLDEKKIKKLKPIIAGVSVSVETVNWSLRKKLCPSKPIEPMLRTLELCRKYNIKKGMTIILGLGEMTEDFKELTKFIKGYELDQVTFYRLKAHPETIFYGKKELESKDYMEWVKRTRQEFPGLKIIAGSWLGHLEEIHSLLENGADDITKFPALKLFGSRYARQIEAEVKKAGRKLLGTLTKLPEIDWGKEVELLRLEERLEREVEEELKGYWKMMG